MQMDAGMDTGNIISQTKFPLPFNWTCLDCIEHMQKIGPQFLNASLRNYAKKGLKSEPQDHTQALHCKKIEKSDGEIQVSSESLDAIYAKYRAYYLWPKIHFIHQEKTIIIEKLLLDEKHFVEHKDKPLISGDKLNPTVKEIFLKPEGKKAMDRASFKNGYRK